ncbi:MAG: sugar-transfer associated ATP-grasp domain-containing protein [Bacteroidota bacterium]
MIIKKLQKALRRVQKIPLTDHKSYLLIVFELIAWIISNRGELNYYFDYELYIRGRRVADYLKTSEFRRIEKELNSPEYFPILEDKYFFYQTLEGQGFHSPRNLFIIDPSGIYSMESRRPVTHEEFLQCDFDGFCKVINGYGGKMIYQVEVSSQNLFVNKERVLLTDFLQFLEGRKYLIQERITQHKEMNVLNPSCINTMRMLTIRTGQEYLYYQGFLRIGINNSYVDNSLSGNITVGIDHNTASLMEFAMSSHIEHRTMDRHPQTGTVFKGFKIPFYNESVEMVKSLHGIYQQFFMIGWDIGITPEGPIVIEGNNITGLDPFQTLYGGLKSSFLNLAQEYRMAV